MKTRGLVILILLAIAAVAFGPPLGQGFHLGCNAYDHLRTVRLGIEFCK